MATGRDWLAMSPKDFDQDAADVQEALFVAPDPFGTPDMTADIDTEGSNR